jgi:hypothetical protein
MEHQVPAFDDAFFNEFEQDWDWNLYMHGRNGYSNGGGTDVLFVECDCKQHAIVPFLVLLSLFHLAVFLSFVLVGVFVFAPMQEITENEKVEYPEHVVEFEDKYPIKRATQAEDVCLNPNSYVSESTPEGMVFMRYDENEEGFIYWADRAIRYTSLEVVARKYVTFFQCKDYYVDRYGADEDSEEEEVDAKTDDGSGSDSNSDNEDQNEDVTDNVTETAFTDKSPFATFKKYKSSGTGGGNTNRQANSNKEGCKFIRRGRISDFNLLKNEYVSYEPKQKMDFESFKKMFFEKTQSKATK